jgi:hypothetical protein
MKVRLQGRNTPEWYWDPTREPKVSSSLHSAKTAVQNLVVEDFEISTLADPIWAEYKEDGHMEVLARKQALRFRAIFMPHLPPPSLECESARVGLYTVSLTVRGRPNTASGQPPGSNRFVGPDDCTY